MRPSEIGWYQVANLVRSRIPFLIFQINSAGNGDGEKNFDLKKLFSVVDGVSLRNWLTDLSASDVDQSIKDILQVMQERGAGKEFPLLIICSDGVLSAQIVDRLAEQEIGNAYSAFGGFKQLEIDHKLGD